MVDGVQAGFAPAAGAKILPQKRNKNDVIRRIVNQELRYRELVEKAKKGELTNDEKIDLAVIAFNRGMDKVQDATVCYVA